MNRLEKIRIFLTDVYGNYYRIASIANPKDHKGEYYLKMMFPDIKGIPLISGRHEKGGDIKRLNLEPGGVQEFTYHYRSGISHFKDGKEYLFF